MAGDGPRPGASMRTSPRASKSAPSSNSSNRTLTAELEMLDIEDHEVRGLGTMGIAKPKSLLPLPVRRRRARPRSRGGLRSSTMRPPDGSRPSETRRRRNPNEPDSPGEACSSRSLFDLSRLHRAWDADPGPSAGRPACSPIDPSILHRPGQATAAYGDAD